MKVCAVSDLHGRLPDIPTCDVLLIAGDICPDTVGPRVISICDPDMLRVGQMGWLEDDFYMWLVGLPVKRILCTPGNHDWITKFPEKVTDFGCTLHVDELVEYEGKRFYFTPWVNPCGPWNYQQERARRKGLFAYIPTRLDVLVSHGPAHDVLDRSYGAKLYGGIPGEPCGCPELRREIYEKKPRYMVHGHIHEGQRYGKEAILGSTIVYNVAMWGATWEPRVFEI